MKSLAWLWMEPALSGMNKWLAESCPPSSSCLKEECTPAAEKQFVAWFVIVFLNFLLIWGAWWVAASCAHCWGRFQTLFGGDRGGWLFILSYSSEISGEAQHRQQELLTWSPAWEPASASRLIAGCASSEGPGKKRKANLEFRSSILIPFPFSTCWSSISIIVCIMTIFSFHS